MLLSLYIYIYINNHAVHHIYKERVFNIGDREYIDLRQNSVDSQWYY